MAVQGLHGRINSWCIKVQQKCTLLYKEYNSASYLPLNILEKVSVYEQFHDMYLVMGMQAVDQEGTDIDYLHSIVFKVGDNWAQFHVETLLENLTASSQVELEKLFYSKYSPWKAYDVDTENQCLN
jgi:hypothetical protein